MGRAPWVPPGYAYAGNRTFIHLGLSLLLLGLSLPFGFKPLAGNIKWNLTVPLLLWASNIQTL